MVRASVRRDDCGVEQMKLKTATLLQPLWTCNECGQRRSRVVEIGEDDYYESQTADICEECLRKAIELITEERKTDLEQRIEGLENTAWEKSE